MSVGIKSAVGGTASGKSGKIIGGTKLSSEATIVDQNAQFNIIQKTNSSSSDQSVFDITFNKLELGTYSIIIRMKVSDITKDINALNVKVHKDDSSGDILGEYNINPTMFKANNEYKSIGFTVNFNHTKGGKLYIEASMPSNSTPVTIGIDYIMLSPAYTSISSL